jgi:hypothetical protein
VIDEHVRRLEQRLVPLTTARFEDTTSLAWTIIGSPATSATNVVVARSLSGVAALPCACS